MIDIPPTMRRVEGFVDKIPSVEGGKIKVEKRDLGIRIGKVDTSKAPTAVAHTMETDHIDISWGNGAAHFALGRHRGAKHPVLQQTIPLGYMATALANASGGVETNRWVRLQVEAAWFSSLEPYLPDEEHQILYASLMEFAEQELGVPEVRHFKDVLDRPPMATTSYYRRHAGIWGVKGGWYNHAEVPENCVSADTPVLCADLVWRPAGDLIVGDELVAFDAESPGRPGRSIRRSVVTANSIRRDALLLVNTSMGPIRCNRQHPWLVRRGPQLQWVRAADLVPFDEAIYLWEPWTTDRSWESGWLAGIFDGEGCLSVSKSGVHLSAAQRESETAERIIHAMKERAATSVIRRGGWGPNSTNMVQVQVQSIADVMRLLGSVRPPRLLAKANAVWEGRNLGRAARSAVIESIEPWGTGHIAALSTSTETYIAGGFAMHNSHWDSGSLRLRVMLKMEAAPQMIDAYQLVATWRESGDDPHREREAVSPHFTSYGDLEKWIAKDPDNIRHKVFKHLKDGHRLHIAHRRVDADEVRG